jgi:hypothetical protein
MTYLGGASTCVASYLARARGSKEPELSISRVKDLDMFIRECEAFETDFGHHEGSEYDLRLNALRKKFEELLGHASGLVLRFFFLKNLISFAPFFPLCCPFFFFCPFLSSLLFFLSRRGLTHRRSYANTLHRERKLDSPV